MSWSVGAGGSSLTADEGQSHRQRPADMIESRLQDAAEVKAREKQKADSL